MPGSVSRVVATVLGTRVDTAFALMGNGNAWLIDALPTAGIAVVPVRHEAATVAAADAYGRASRRLAVATTTYGPGFTNALTPLAEAALARTPLLLVAGGPPTSGLRDFDVDQMGMARACGAQVFAATAADAATVTRQALDAVADGPVVLLLPDDQAELPTVSSEEPAPAPEDHPGPDVREAARLLAQAESPLVLAGRGADDSLTALARRLGADVATTAPATGFFRGVDGVRDLGICGGFASPGGAAAIAAADVVLVAGAGLNDFTMAHGAAFGRHARVIQVDRRDGPTHPRVDLFLRGDAGVVCRALLSALAGVDRDPTPEPVVGHPAGDPLAPDGRLDPRSLFTRLDALLPPDRIVVTDGGHFLAWPCTYLSVPGPEHLILVGTAFRSIGLGFPSAVGVAAAAAGRTTVLVTGDGGGLMGLADAESLLRVVRDTGGRCVIVLVNDAAYGAEIHQYATRGVDPAAMLIPEVDFAALLGSLGARSQVVRTLDDLESLRDHRDGTLVLDCRVSRDVVAPFLHRAANDSATRSRR